MKKNHFIFSIITLVLLVVFITSFNYFKTTNTYIEDNINNQTKITKGISMNLEQTAGAGDYKTVTQSGWPTEGYKFNTELSRCENGSTLSWDDTKKVVVVSGNLSDKCYVYFDIITTPSIANYCSSGTDLGTCVKNFGNQGAEISNIYIHNSSLTNGAGDNSYRFAGGDYQLTGKAKSAGLKSLLTSLDDESGEVMNDGIVKLFCAGEYSHPLLCDTTSGYYYTLQYDTTNTQYQTYKSALEKAVSDGYLTKDNIKNFVCFGTNESPCPTDNLYRIIGVIDGKVKLIKYDYSTKEQLGERGDYAGSDSVSNLSFESMIYKGDLTTVDWYYWNNSTKTNTWSESLLNKINLNTNFINNMDSTWSSKIIVNRWWKVGGNTSANISQSLPSITYTNEITSPLENTTYEAKIGLMYVSDFGFATSPSAWTTQMDNFNGHSPDGNMISDTNWMYMGFDEWTITRNTINNKNVFIVQNYFGLGDNSANFQLVAVRPTFYLVSTTSYHVSYVSGTGTQSDPIIIN